MVRSIYLLFLLLALATATKGAGKFQETIASVDECDDNRDCGSCASNDRCMWCASEKRCTRYADFDCNGGVTFASSECPHALGSHIAANVNDTSGILSNGNEKTIENDNSSSSSSSSSSDDDIEDMEVLLLPSPEENDTEGATGGRKSLKLGETLKLTEAGPMIINSDGTVRRIANWHTLTAAEQENSWRIISARNRKRLVALKEKKKLGIESRSRDDL